MVNTNNVLDLNALQSPSTTVLTLDGRKNLAGRVEAIKLTTPNYNVRQIDYPDLLKVYKLGRRSLWNEDEINFESDELDWKVRMTEEQKQFVGRVLKGFTTTEMIVNNHWHTVAKAYPRPEVSSVASMFTYQETVHTWAYNKLEEVLGLNSYEEFVKDKTAMVRFNNIWEKLQDGDITQLAIFACVEGISLFSSFLLLLSFTYRKNYLINIKDILGWSLLDESIHSLVGTKLVQIIKIERGYDFTKEEIQTLKQAITHLVDIELQFAKSCFGEVDFLPEIISFEEIKSYILERAHDLINNLGLSNYLSFENPSPKGRDLSQFMTMIQNTTHGDFFAQGKLSDSYSTRVDIDWSKVKFHVG